MQQRQWIRVGILSLLLAVLVGACSDDGGDDDPNPRTVNLRGDWRGSWQSTVFVTTGPIIATIGQRGHQLSGTVTLTNVACGQRGTFMGSVDADMFEARLRDGAGVRVDLVGDVAEDEQSINGTYSVIRGGNCTGDRGTFQLERD